MINKSLPLLLVVAAVGLVGLLALVTPVAAQQSLTRSFSDTVVAPGDELTVTISGIGLSDAPRSRSFGEVTETLPSGFSYVADSAAIVVGGDRQSIIDDNSGQDVTFTYVRIDSFSYGVSVDANAPLGVASFHGQDDAGDDVGGADHVTVQTSPATPQPTPTTEPTPTQTAGTGDVTRSLPSSSVTPGDDFTVTISGVGLGDAAPSASFGLVIENLPEGFTYVDGSAAVASGGSGATIRVDKTGPGVVEFTVVRVDSFTYDVAVGSNVPSDSYTFSGSAELDAVTNVGGNTTVTVQAVATPTPGVVSRSFSDRTLDAGDEFTVTISGVDLGDAAPSASFGLVVEMLPEGFTYVDGSAAVASGGSGATIRVDETSSGVEFTVVRVDSFTYKVAVGASVPDDVYSFRGSAELDVVSAIGGETSVRVGPEPTATPVPPTATPVPPTATPVPDDGTPTPATRTPRPTAVPPAPATPVAIEKVDATAVEGATVVEPDMSATVSSADGMATVMLPNTSRARTYQVMVVTDAANCEGAEGTLKACAMVKSFDAEGNLESDVELIRRATVVITLSSSMVEDLGGLPVVFQANALGGFNVQQMSAGGAWSDRGFSMGLTDDGGVAVTVTGLRSFGSIALTVDEDILQTAMYQVAGITPTAVPTPEPTATSVPEPTAVPPDDEGPPVGDATAPIGLLVVLALTGALMVYTGSRVMRGRRSTVR